MTSRWRRQIEEIRSRIPREFHDPVTGIFLTYLKPGFKDQIAGFRYDACAGYEHPLDGQSITFDPPIDRDQLPSPWRELRLEVDAENAAADAAKQDWQARFGRFGRFGRRNDG
jgi:hypothetical protein